MKFKKIGTKLLAGILTPVIIAMALLTVISAEQSKSLVTEQTQDRMTAELAAQKAAITGEMNVISSTVNNIAGTVGGGYKTSTQYSLETALQQSVLENDSVYGCGIWFEPRVFKASEEYMGPYVHRDDSSEINSKKTLEITYDRSTAEYDYFNREYYLLGKTAEEPVFTAPYYDEMSGKTLVTCTMSMYNVLGNFIGCATVDMELSTVQSEINAIQIGEKGDAILLDGSTGVYLGCADESKVSAGASILEEENASMAAAGQEILSQESGVTSYRDGSETYMLYYDTIPEVNWKLVMRIPQSQLNAPIMRLLQLLTALGVAAAVITILMILLQVRSISRGIRKVQGFAGTLAQGDFSVEPMSIRRIDELGQMGRSLNAMYESNKGVLGSISVHAEEINESSEKLNTAAEELLGRFEDIENLMSSVNEAMMSASAATEQVNASAEEVASSVNVLADETEKSRGLMEEIKARARTIETSSRESYENATRLSGQYEGNLKKSIENAKIVESIGKMAEVISDIAGQINLLSLNASIEAARAGEQGRGFAVVATEIGKLAGETADAVDEIQKTIEEVKQAFGLLTEDSQSLIKFLKETVTPDYDKFVDVAKQYGEDAVAIEATSSKISNMAGNIESIMSEVTNAVQNIAESTQETADNSSRIMETVNEVSGVVDRVSEMSKNQEDIAGDLHEVVGKFKLN